MLYRVNYHNQNEHVHWRGAIVWICFRHTDNAYFSSDIGPITTALSICVFVLENARKYKHRLFANLLSQPFIQQRKQMIRNGKLLCCCLLIFKKKKKKKCESWQIMFCWMKRVSCHQVLAMRWLILFLFVYLWTVLNLMMAETIVEVQF